MGQYTMAYHLTLTGSLTLEGDNSTDAAFQFLARLSDPTFVAKAAAVRAPELDSLRIFAADDVTILAVSGHADGQDYPEPVARETGG